MSELRFYGMSDDLIEVEGLISEEYSADQDDTASFLVTRQNIDGDVEGCEVQVRYTTKATWAVAISQIEEGFPVPWPVRIETAHDYSMALILDVSDDVTVERLS